MLHFKPYTAFSNIFCTWWVQTMTTFMPSRTATTFLIFHFQDNNIMILEWMIRPSRSIMSELMRYDTAKEQCLRFCTLYCWHSKSYESIFMQVKTKLRGHSERITGLAFLHLLSLLVSSGADVQVNYYFSRVFFLPFSERIRTTSYISVYSECTS